METNTLSRRHAFKIAGLAGAAVALRGGASYGQEAAARRMAPAKPLPQGAGFYRTHVGELEVTIVSDGQFPLTPYPTIGSNATQAEVEGLLKDNFIDPAKLMGQVNVLTVRRGNGPVTVFDTGSGKLFGPAAGFAKQNLIASGVNLDEVANVVFTHLHPDHAGGALNEDGSLLFPSAKHWAHKKEVAFWSGASPDLSKSGVPEAMRSGMVATAKKVIDTLGTKLATFEKLGDVELPVDGHAYEIDTGIYAVHTGGHTPGHCAIAFKDGSDTLIYVTDLVVQSVLCLAHPEWLVGFDTDMQATVGIRKTLYAKLAETRVAVSGAHLPFPALGHVKKDGAGYAFVPAPWSWS